MSTARQAQETAMNAHDVRNLVICTKCGEPRDAREIIHLGADRECTRCFYRTRGLEAIFALPREDQGKFRMSDMPPDQMRRLVDHFAAGE